MNSDSLRAQLIRLADSLSGAGLATRAFGRETPRQPFAREEQTGPLSALFCFNYLREKDHSPPLCLSAEAQEIERCLSNVKSGFCNQFL